MIRNLSRPDPRPENGIPQGQVFTGPWSTLPWGKECQPSREGSSSGRQQRYNSLPRRPTGLLLLCSLWVTGKGLSTDGVTIFYLPISQPIPRPGVSLPSSHCPVDKQINKQKKRTLSHPPFMLFQISKQNIMTQIKTRTIFPSVFSKASRPVVCLNQLTPIRMTFAPG